MYRILYRTAFDERVKGRTTVKLLINTDLPLTRLQGTGVSFTVAGLKFIENLIY